MHVRINSDNEKLGDKMAMERYSDRKIFWTSIFFCKEGESSSIQFHFGNGSIVLCQVSQGNLQLTGVQKCIHL